MPQKQNFLYKTLIRVAKLLQETVLVEAQRSFDRSLSIFSTVSTLMGVLIGLITIIVAVGAAYGFFESRKWHRLRVEADKKLEHINKKHKEAEDISQRLQNIKENVEKERLEINLPSSLSEKPSPAVEAKLAEFTSRLELLEQFGAELKAEDYFAKATDFYYKWNYGLALEAYTKAIELKPDFADAWSNKGVTLTNFKRYDEALEAYAKAIELKPDSAPAWFNRACSYCLKGDIKNALSDLKEAIRLDNSLKDKAKTDKDFESIWGDEDFKKIVE